MDELDVGSKTEWGNYHEVEYRNDYKNEYGISKNGRGVRCGMCEIHNKLYKAEHKKVELTMEFEVVMYVK